MKKALKIIIPVLVVLLVAGGLLFGFAHGKNLGKGTLLRGKNGVVFWINEYGSPILLSYMNDTVRKTADKLGTGDAILLLYDGIEESYPGRTGCYLLVRTGGGKEIPAETLNELAAMGWIDGPSDEDAQTPPGNDTEEQTAPADEPEQTQQQDVTDIGSLTQEFGLRLFSELYRGKKSENALFSPVSLYMTLALTADGAAGDTRSQLETLLGGENGEKRGDAVKTLTNALNKNKAARMANGIWMNKTFILPDEAFSTLAEKLYGAKIASFSPNGDAVREINGWAQEKTGGRIPAVLNDLDPDTLLVLVNALTFDAEWQNKYDKGSVKEGTFVSASGKRRKVNMMVSVETRYLETENARGFIKPYKNGNVFAALLPSEGVEIGTVLESLCGGAMRKVLRNPQSVYVIASMPQFGFEDETDLIPVLKNFGVTDLFDKEKADLSGFGELQPPYNKMSVSLVLQKTALDVTPDGTSAAAVTVEAVTGSGTAQRMENVVLDRPFLFLILDGNGVPLFIGVVNNV